MEYIKLKAMAKINLSLDVIGKRPDGYHNLEMIMQSLSLYDGVYIKKVIGGGLKVKTNLEWLPVDERNLAYKAAKFLKERYDIKEGIFIELDKRIPVAAGLAGGSSNCAAVLVGINKLFNLNISMEKLMEYGLKLGADVPYCIMRGTVLAEGVGEILTRLPSCPFAYFVLVKPPVSVSTAFVFKNLDCQRIESRPNTNKILEEIKEGNLIGISNSLCNVLETVVLPIHPEIADIKKELLCQGALGAAMSGSGPTVFGVFEDKEKAKLAAEHIKHTLGIRDVFVTTIFDVKKRRVRFK